MAKNLWDYFNCQSFDELYLKLKMDDPSVKSLNDFYHHYQASLEGNSLNSPEKVAKDIYQRNLLPPKGTFSIICTNVKLYPLAYHNFDVDTPFKDIFKRIYSPDLQICCVANTKGENGEKVWNRVKEVSETLENGFHVDTVDSLKFQENNIFYSSAEHSELNFKPNLFLFSYAKKDSIAYTRPHHKLESQENVDQFSVFYAGQELKGKNLLYDKEIIDRLLQMGYSDCKQEYFSLITYDANYNIQHVQNLSLGTGQSTLFPLGLPSAYAPDSGKGGGIVFHNHPTGNSAPSQADIQSMKNIYQTFQLLDKEMFDALIVGKDKVYSFANDGTFLKPEFISMCDHQRNIKRGYPSHFEQAYPSSRVSESATQLSLFSRFSDSNNEIITQEDDGLEL